MLPGDRYRQIANRGEVIQNLRGVRPYTVSIITEAFAAAIGNGVAVTGRPGITITPPPRVKQISFGDPSWFAGGIVAEAGMRLSGLAFDIGPMVQAFPGAGYTAQQLVPQTTDTKHRPIVLLTGPDIDAAGEYYEVRRVWTEDGGFLYLMMTVQRTSQT